MCFWCLNSIIGTHSYTIWTSHFLPTYAFSVLYSKKRSKLTLQIQNPTCFPIFHQNLFKYIIFMRFPNKIKRMVNICSNLWFLFAFSYSLILVQILESKISCVWIIKSKMCYECRCADIFVILSIFHKWKNVAILLEEQGIN